MPPHGTTEDDRAAEYRQSHPVAAVVGFEVAGAADQAHRGTEPVGAQHPQPHDEPPERPQAAAYQAGAGRAARGAAGRLAALRLATATAGGP
jgi:hypothetical protein